MLVAGAWTLMFVVTRTVSSTIWPAALPQHGLASAQWAHAAGRVQNVKKNKKTNHDYVARLASLFEVE